MNIIFYSIFCLISLQFFVTVTMEQSGSSQHIHAPKPYACAHSGCNKAFDRKKHLENHARIHTGEKPYTCTHSGCNKAFTTVSILNAHARIHTGEKPHICPHPGCNQAFATSYNRNRHLHSHKTSLNKKATQSSKITAKQEIDQKEATAKKYECPQCEKTFQSLYHLKRHSSKHTGEKPYECKECNQKFTQSHNLKNHLPIHKRLISEIISSQDTQEEPIAKKHVE